MRKEHQRLAGFSLIEVMVAVTISVLLGSVGFAYYGKMLEQSSADLACSHLEAIWTAQRFYFLEKGRYAKSLKDLEKEKILDTAPPPAGSRFTYGIKSADKRTFVAFAKRTGSKKWTGQFTITPKGVVAGQIKASGGDRINPPKAR